MINKQKQSGPEVAKPSTIFNPICRTSVSQQKGVAWKGTPARYPPNS